VAKEYPVVVHDDSGRTFTSVVAGCFLVDPETVSIQPNEVRVLIAPQECC